MPPILSIVRKLSTNGRLLPTGINTLQTLPNNITGNAATATIANGVAIASITTASFASTAKVPLATKSSTANTLGTQTSAYSGMFTTFYNDSTTTYNPGDTVPSATKFPSGKTGTCLGYSPPGTITLIQVI